VEEINLNDIVVPDAAHPFATSNPRFKTGRLPRKPRFGMASLGNHLSLSQLPVPPTAGGWGYKIPDDQWLVLGNDDYGDCVIATIMHLIMEWTAGTGNPLTATTDLAVKTYLAWTGGQDTGLAWTDALLLWQNQGVPMLDSKGNQTIHKILGSAALDISSLEQLNAATYLFQGTALGINCPASAVSNLTNWVYVPGSPNEGGHAIPRMRYGRAGGHIVSWGLSIPHTNDFMTVNLEEGYVVVSEDMLNLNTGKSPIGLDVNGLLNTMKLY